MGNPADVNSLNLTAQPHLAVKVKRPGERRSSSRTATRALDVMEMFGECRSALRAVDIGRALGTTPSTTNQLLKTMVDSGHLVFDAKTKAYVPSPRLMPFAWWITETYGTAGRIGELIERIKDDLGMVVTVSTPNDLFMQIIDSAMPEGKSAERGLMISLFGSAIGNACLSVLDPVEVERLARRARISSTEISSLQVSIGKIREQGFATGPSLDGAIWSVAIPLPLQGLPGPAVLGLAGPPEEIQSRLGELVGHLQRAVGDFLRVTEAG